MRPFADDRAMRNVIGFTLAFSVIVVSSGVVVTFGHAELEGISESEQLNNAEEAMELVAGNFQQLQQQRASVRSNEINLAGGSLGVVDGGSVTVRAAGPNTDFEETIAVGGLQYRLDQTTITYEAGGLFRTRRDDPSALVTPPTMTCTERQAIVSVVVVEERSTNQITGDYVTISGAAESRELLFPINRTGANSTSDVAQANVTLSSPRMNGWDRYFADAGNWTESPRRDDTYLCDNVESVYVRRAVITVGFDS